LLFLNDIAPIPSLIEETQNEHNIKTTDAKDQPIDILPGAGTSDNEVREQGAEVRRSKEDCRPDTDFPSMFMEKEHVL
jgi:hypothetical protein